MNVLLQIFGWPHEMLHVLALRLIGRRPEAVRQTHVDIPDDLSTAQYVFVAGLPAMVFGLGVVIGVQMLLSAVTVPQALLGLLIAAFFSLGALGTVGDLLLILDRLVQPRPPEGCE